MKDIKMKTKMIAGYVIAGLLLVINAVISDMAMKEVLNAADHETYIERATMFTTVIAVVSLIVMTVIAVSMVGTLRKSIKHLADAAKQIAMGRVDVELVKENNDEFGELLDEYGKVVDNIKYQSKVAEEVSHGNLTITVTPRSSEDVLGNSLKKLVDDNLNALSHISEIGTQVTISTSQVASAIEEITSSINEVAERTKSNAEQANQAAKLVVTAIEDVKQGNKQMHEMIDAMNDINKASESISKIIKTIDDIAFQTNILALNAAVEAARAGDAGKGFAVVAEEVRSLAAKSAAASAETAELIEDSIIKVNLGSNIAGETAKALEAITEVVKQSETIINGIAEASNYQATAAAQIEQAITQVSQVVQTNSSTSEECAAASEELSNQAAKMRDKLSIYNLGNASASSSYKGSSSSYNSSMSSMSEPTISLDDDFGKY